MIDKSFLEKVEAMTAPTIISIGDMPYSSKGLNLISPPQAAKFSVCSLSALIDFCENEMESGKHVMHILDHNKVLLFGEIDKLFRNREVFVKSEAIVSAFSFGRFYRVDEFIINLQAEFVQDEVTANILKLVGNITRVSEVGTRDDGMTQRVEAKSGLAKVENISVPNPVTLAPYRTFIEIGQPSSNFVLRLNERHECALFEADGGAWRVEAMRNIKVFLDNNLNRIGKREQVTILC